MKLKHILYGALLPISTAAVTALLYWLITLAPLTVTFTLIGLAVWAVGATMAMDMRL
jgi:hypothetical protein